MAAVAVAVAITYTVLATLGIRRPGNVVGVEPYAVGAGLNLLALLGGIYWRDLGIAARSLLVVRILRGHRHRVGAPTSHF